MKKTIRSIAVLMVLVLSLSFSACSEVQSFIKGDVTGELNKTYSTQWFDFTVKSIKTAYSYGEFYTDDGWKFVIVRVSEKNTFNTAIPMSAYDFFLKAEGLEEEDGWPLSPLEGSEDTMMPEEFEIRIGGSAEYDVVFSIPDEITDISFIYEEIDDKQNVGATFTIKHSL